MAFAGSSLVGYQLVIKRTFKRRLLTIRQFWVTVRSAGRLFEHGDSDGIQSREAAHEQRQPPGYTPSSARRHPLRDRTGGQAQRRVTRVRAALDGADLLQSAGTALRE